MLDYNDNPWRFFDTKVPLTSDHITDYQGMVYLIVNNNNNRKYVGKKFFWSQRTLPALKGKTRKRKKIIESDWQSYWGSSNELKADLEKYNYVNFERYVLKLCNTKTECAYYELEEQVNRKVLLTEVYYNDFIGGKINGRHLRK